MGKPNEKSYGLRVHKDILAKFRHVCNYEGRSANSQLIRLMLKFIRDYEDKYGAIVLMKSEDRDTEKKRSN